MIVPAMATTTVDRAVDIPSPIRHNPQMDTQTATPEQVILELRARVVAGEALTREQVRQGLAALRANRVAAASASNGRKAAKASQPVRSPAELLAQLKGSIVSK